MDDKRFPQQPTQIDPTKISQGQKQADLAKLAATKGLGVPKNKPVQQGQDGELKEIFNPFKKTS